MDVALPELHLNNADEPDPADAAMAAEEQAAIRAAVDGLPRALREVVVLYYLHGMPVAEVLGLSRENVKSRLHRARGRLRDLLMQPPTEERGI